MATITEVCAGDHFAVTYNGAGTGLTGITRSQLAAGSANHVVINDGSGAMTSEAQLANTRGGTGVNSSAFSGVAKVAAGVWSAATIVDADVSASAAITRSKLANGTANHVLINTAGGVFSSEAQLAVSRGGTGQDFSGVGAGPFVITNISGTMASSVVYTASATASTVMFRDASANTAINQLTAATIASTGNLTITPSGGSVLFGTSIPTLTPTTTTGGTVTFRAANVTTANAAATTLFTLATASGTNGTAYSIAGLVACGNATSTNTTATIQFHLKAKNILGTLTVSAILSKSAARDAGLGAVDVSVTTSGTNVLVQVNGIAATNLVWAGKFDVVTQQF